GNIRMQNQRLLATIKYRSPDPGIPLYVVPNRIFIFFFQAEDGIRDLTVTGVQTCALPISGRAGNTEGLALDAAGVESDGYGRVKVDDCYRTSAAGIYAAGDVVGPPALASVSMEQARV